MEYIEEYINHHSVKNSSFNFSFTNQTALSSGRDENLAKAEVATLMIIFILTIIGNTLVLIALAVRRVKMNRMYYFLLNLCVSDLITAVFSVLPQLAWDITHRFYGGNLLCKLVKYLQVLGPYLSSYILVMTAVDRYQAICYPLLNYSWTSSRTYIMVGIAWIISLIFCVPQIFIFSFQQVPGHEYVYDCWATFVQPWGEKAYVTWFAVTVFFIPLIFLFFTYIHICRAIWVNLRLKRKSCRPRYSDEPDTNGYATGSSRRSKLVVSRSISSKTKDQVKMKVYGTPSNPSGSTMNPRSHSIRGLTRAKMKTIKLTVVVISFYIICSTPFICVQLWASWDPNAQQSSIWTGPTITILMLLSTLNSCVNPWIYLGFNNILLQGLKHFFCQISMNSCKRKTLGSEIDINKALSQNSRSENTSCSSVPICTFNNGRNLTTKPIDQRKNIDINMV